MVAALKLVSSPTLPLLLLLNQRSLYDSIMKILYGSYLLRGTTGVSVPGPSVGVGRGSMFWPSWFMSMSSSSSVSTIMDVLGMARSDDNEKFSRG